MFRVALWTSHEDLNGVSLTMAYPPSLRLVACLLNISEGRERRIVESIANAAVNFSSTSKRNYLECHSTVLNIFSDYDYNRSVITIAASVDDIEESVFRACEVAYKEIDLERHAGGHPRLGSVDLVPIHTITSSVSLEECGEIAISLGNRLVNSIKGTSVFLFGHADRPLLRGLVQRRKAVNWYNGKNDCQDLVFGKEIAKSIRSSTSSGLAGVQSMAFEHEGRIEIACNVEASVELSSDGNFQYTSSEGIESRVRELAALRDIKLYGTKLVGFTPDEAYRRAVKALSEGNATAWKHSEYRM
ncbi:uncharacterized protein [Acropora muricata]|uniref:uncharacterized protein isoform X2 n=1 Tax=Acropora muricata TaxID=159855 RepID=UPI0034E57FAC